MSLEVTRVAGTGRLDANDGAPLMAHLPLE